MADAYPIALIEEALTAIKQGDQPAAAWRLVDALGYLADLYPQVDNAMGVNMPTGMGFQLVRRRGGTSTVVKVK